MKQTDFDFIRDKFSSDGVHAPDELNEELVQRQLAGVQPLQEKKSHKVLIGTVSVAASVAEKADPRTPDRHGESARFSE